MSGQDEKFSDFTVDELVVLSDQDQAERIADHYASISQEYEPVKNEDFPEFSVPSNFRPPKVGPTKVEKIINSMNKKAAGVPGDVPMKLIGEFSYQKISGENFGPKEDLGAPKFIQDHRQDNY